VCQRRLWLWRLDRVVNYFGLFLGMRSYPSVHPKQLLACCCWCVELLRTQPTTWCECRDRVKQPLGAILKWKCHSRCECFRFRAGGNCSKALLYRTLYFGRPYGNRSTPFDIRSCTGVIYGNTQHLSGTRRLTTPPKKASGHRRENQSSLGSSVVAG